jgi:topoisomerase-4 subunit A
MQCLAGDLIGRNKAGKQFVTLEDQDSLIRPELVPEGAKEVACLVGAPDRARLLIFPLADIKTLRSGGRGTRLAELEPREALLQVLAFGGVASPSLQVSGLGRAARPMDRVLGARELQDFRSARGRKGRLIEPRWKDTRLVRHRPDGASGDASGGSA